MANSKSVGCDSKTIFLGTHASTLLEELNKERITEESYCDVILCINEREFCGHRCVLGKLSKMLDRMFKIKMRERNEQRIPLGGVDPDAMHLVMEYIYTSRIEISKENAMDLLSVSDYLQIDALKQHCLEFFLQGMNTENILSLRKAAELYNERTVVKNATTFVASNLESIVQQAEYKNFSKDDVLSVLESRKCKENYEELAYKSFVTWANHDVPGRKEDFVELLKTVKLRLLSTKQLEEVAAQSLVKKSHACKDFLVTELLHRLKIPPLMNAQLEGQALGHKRTRGVNLFVFNCMNKIKLFDVETLLFSDLPDLPHDCDGACVVASGNKIFVIGGEEKRKSILCLRHDKPGDNWRVIGNTLEPHYHSSATLHRGLVFITGSRSKSVECFDPTGSVPHCVKTTPMLSQRGSHPAIDFCGHLICGPSGFSNLSVECLDDNKAEWSTVFGELRHRSQFFAVVEDRELWTIDEMTRFHRLHPVLKEWIEVDTDQDTEVLVKGALAVEEVLHLVIIDEDGIWNLRSYNTLTKLWSSQEIQVDDDFDEIELVVVSAICLS